MNGLLMTAGSLGNGAGPILGSVLYALALTLPQGALGPAVPLDGRLVFLIGGIMFVMLAWYAKHYMCEMK
jgi:hypothetical protein